MARVSVHPRSAARWLILVYVYLETEDRVGVVTIQDARSSTAATANRP
jgi:hypothetical protein